MVLNKWCNGFIRNKAICRDSELGMVDLVKRNQAQKVTNQQIVGSEASSLGINCFRTSSL